MTGKAHGKKPFSWAMENEHNEVAELLLVAEGNDPKFPPSLQGYSKDWARCRAGYLIEPITPVGTLHLGQHNLSFRAEGLPHGLQIDPENGVISGKPKIEAEAEVEVVAENDYGRRVCRLHISVDSKSNFAFTAPFDTHGVLFHIATGGGAEEWGNPHNSGRVTCLCAHI